VRNWADLPRDVQELLFEDATEANEALRQELPVYIHGHHPRTVHPAKNAVQFGARISHAIAQPS
jgi:hypothetical protein